MRSIFFTLIVVLGTSFTLQEEATLARAIGYYQQLKFEKSIEIFDQLVTESPDDISLRGRRGFVCYKYIYAVDNGLIDKISADRYTEVVTSGMNDLKDSLDKYPGNRDNSTAYKYLKERG